MAILPGGVGKNLAGGGKLGIYYSGADVIIGGFGQWNSGNRV